jgi:hypothetical protein
MLGDRITKVRKKGSADDQVHRLHWQRVPTIDHTNRPMKTPQLTLRDLFWLSLVVAIVSFGFAREVTRDRHIQSMERKLDYLPSVLYPESGDDPQKENSPDEEKILSVGMLNEGESVEVLCHHNQFDYTVRLKSKGEIVEKRFTVKLRSCGMKLPAP